MVRSSLRLVALAFSLAALSAPSASAALLVNYNLTGQPGNQATVAPLAAGAGVSGQALTRGAGLTAVSGVDSINSSGFTGEATDFLSLGFTNNTAGIISVNELLVGSRSSNTGPGFVNVSYRLGAGAETVLGTLAQSGTANLFTDLTFNVAVAAGQTFTIFFRAANTTSANGGTTASGGTFRLTNYFNGATDTGSLALNGTFATGPAVPEPASVVLLGLGLAGVATVARRRARPVA